jgi:hypothetical protein
VFAAVVGPTTPGEAVTATATDSFGNTSEFSLGQIVVGFGRKVEQTQQGTVEVATHPPAFPSAPDTAGTPGRKVEGLATEAALELLAPLASAKRSASATSNHGPSVDPSRKRETSSGPDSRTEGVTPPLLPHPWDLTRSPSASLEAVDAAFARGEWLLDEPMSAPIPVRRD